MKRTGRMAKPPQSKDEALEALDFIVNVLKEHERDLDKIVGELATVAEQMGNTGELIGKMEKLEEKINSLQKQVTCLISNISSAPPKPNTSSINKIQTIQAATVAPALPSANPSVSIRCVQWMDFQALAIGAQTLSFSYREQEKIIQANAIKGNQLISYNGPIPKFSAVFKAFLAKELGIPKQNIIEGTLSIE
ncbi:MAG: hypothetical protein IAX22_05250 [Candidatus Bathyarchaeota archaeon]|nr:hypothetical protein [Candidatus Bathyarchaeota archaeon]